MDMVILSLILVKDNVLKDMHLFYTIMMVESIETQFYLIVFHAIVFSKSLDQ